MGTPTLRHRREPPSIKALKARVVEGPDTGMEAVADSETISVGTASNNDLVLTDPTVSRYHMELKCMDGQILVEDLESTNGTIVGNVALERGRLRPGASLQIGQTVLEVIEGDVLSLETLEDDSFFGLYGRSQQMRRLMAKTKRAAPTDLSILLRGETGTGKEVIARSIHRASKRSDGPFEVVDCASLTPTLVASELFGHEKGAFTGATNTHVGAFERAQNGTLFLDEIGELESNLQAALLGALERRTIRRVGGSQSIDVNVRVLAATHRDLRAEVNARSFREDLYYRLAVFRIEVPPLRHRPEDIPGLIQLFLRQSGCEEEPSKMVPPQTMERIMRHRWPGNVRELRNFVDVLFALGEEPLLDDGPKTPTEAPDGSSDDVFAGLFEKNFSEARSLVLSRFEQQYLERLLSRSGSNLSQAARTAGINRRYLFELCRRHGLR